MAMMWEYIYVTKHIQCACSHENCQYYSHVHKVVLDTKSAKCIAALAHAFLKFDTLVLVKPKASKYAVVQGEY